MWCQPFNKKRKKEILGLFDPIKKESFVDENVEERIDAIFSSFASDPKGKTEDFIPTPMTSEEKYFCFHNWMLKLLLSGRPDT